MVSLTAFFVVVLSAAVLADDGSFKFDMNDLGKELGYFSQCKGKKVNYPEDSIMKGMAQVPGCIATVTGAALSGVKLNKPCVALCVAEKIGIISADRIYNYTAAIEPLDKTVTDGKNDKEVIEIQKAAIKRCCKADDLVTYDLKEDCQTSIQFDKCIREAAKTDCGAVEEAPK